jgi:hypothetical protein
LFFHGDLSLSTVFTLYFALVPVFTLCYSLLVSFACSPKIFQKTKCSICNSALELPSVHFLCGHSFHQHCFESYSESDADCPTCLPENRKVMDMIRAQEQKRDLHDQFQHQVGMSGLDGGGDAHLCQSLCGTLEGLFYLLS